jgi:PRTase ComF-like
MQQHFSLHKIYEQEVFTFSPAEYSKFKFGDGSVSANFGIALAKGFIEAVLKLHIPIQQIVVISSPYSFIPTATFAMKNHFVYEINKWLAAENLPVVQETKIHRTITYKEDYGELDAADRMKLIGNDGFHIDKLFLEGKTLIFLDDIKITGGHERMINKMIEAYGISNDRYFLYFAELMNPDIHPKIENHLNYFAVKSIADLVPIINKADFFINTRLVKYILNSDSNDFKKFLLKVDINFINLLYNMALGNGYHTIDAYKGNLEILVLENN